MVHEFKNGYVKVERHTGVTTLEFFHTQSNSLPAAILNELVSEVHAASHDDESKVILIRSAGEKAFCSGASFDELLAISSQEEGTRFFSHFAHLFNAMRKCPKLIIARIQGRCVGGGVGIAAAADYAIAAEGADVRLSELAIGIGPFVVGPVLVRKMGVSTFSQLAIDSGLWRSADWARRKGIYAELHPSISAMDESILRLSQALVHSSPEAMAELKKMFWRGTENWDQLLLERAEISGRLVLSEQARTALSAVRKK
jgi:methylglutaconyl-CoA hydratase